MKNLHNDQSKSHILVLKLLINQWKVMVLDQEGLPKNDLAVKIPSKISTKVSISSKMIEWGLNSKIAGQNLLRVRKCDQGFA